MADVPNAELVWRRHSAQWQMYRARGLGSGVRNWIAPHWQRASMVVVVLRLDLFSFMLAGSCLCVIEGTLSLRHRGCCCSCRGRQGDSVTT